jgi:hypothetical protein
MTSRLLVVALASGPAQIAAQATSGSVEAGVGGSSYFGSFNGHSNLVCT